MQAKASDRETFWAWDFSRARYFELTAMRKHVSPSTWIYVEEGLEIPGPALVRLATYVEDRALPALREGLGEEPNPGVDDEAAITLLLTDIRDAQYYRLPTDHYVAGYFDPANQHTQSTLDASGDSRRSNEREMLYLDVGAPVDPLGDELLRSAAHELSHMILWHHDPDEDAWINEGLSELSGFLTGLGHPREHVNLYLQNTELALTSWQEEPEEIGRSYLFMLYLLDRFGSRRETWLRGLVDTPANGLEGLAEQLSAEGSDPAAVFRDFLLAMHLAEAQPDDPRYRFRSIRLGSNQPPDGFRAPAARHHGADRDARLSFGIAPWASRVDAIDLSTRRLTIELQLPSGACGALAVYETTAPVQADQVETFCLPREARLRWPIDSAASEAASRRALLVLVNPSEARIAGGIELRFRSAPAGAWLAILPILTRR